mgnify:FL=1
MAVRLNAKLYETVGPIIHTPVREFTDAIRTTSQQSRKDRTLLSSWEIDWSQGIGTQRTGDSPSNGVWYSTVDTRFSQQVTLLPLVNTDTRHANMDNGARGIVTFRGVPYCIAHDTANTNYWGFYTWAAGTWSEAAQDTSPGAGTTTPLDLAVHENLILGIAAIPTTGGTNLRFATWDGTTLTTTIPVGLSHANTDTAGVVISDGVNIYVVVRNTGGATLNTVFKSTDDGANFSTYVTYSATGGPTGKAIYYSQDGGIDLWLADATTLRIIDLSTAKITDLQVGPFRVDGGTADDGRNRLVTHQGRLYAIGTREIWEYSWNGNVLV